MIAVHLRGSCAEQAGLAANVDQEMSLVEFACGNLRLAHAKYKDVPSLYEKWRMFLSENVKPFAICGDVADEVRPTDATSSH